MVQYPAGINSVYLPGATETLNMRDEGETFVGSSPKIKFHSGRVCFGK